ncbi:MAG: hypothetical protein U1F43_04795 [Myxococcota bacterium]
MPTSSSDQPPKDPAGPGGAGDASAPKPGPPAPLPPSVTSGLPELDAEFARLMHAFDKVMGQEGQPPVEPEMDPELERKLQEAMAGFLASPRPPVPTGPPGPDGKPGALDSAGLEQALQAHVKPLFDALFTTALGHVKGTADALKAGKEPPPRKGDPIKVDLSALFDPDDDGEDEP